MSEENIASPLPRRLAEATAAFLLNFPLGYDLPPLEILIFQMDAALKAADACQLGATSL